MAKKKQGKQSKPKKAQLKINVPYEEKAMIEEEAVTTDVVLTPVAIAEAVPLPQATPLIRGVITKVEGWTVNYYVFVPTPNQELPTDLLDGHLVDVQFIPPK